VIAYSDTDTPGSRRTPESPEISRKVGMASTVSTSFPHFLVVSLHSRLDMAEHFNKIRHRSTSVSLASGSLCCRAPSRQVRHDQRCNGCSSQIPGGENTAKGFCLCGLSASLPQRSQRCILGVCGHPERHPSKRIPLRIPIQPFRRNLADRHFELCIARAPCPSPMHPLLSQRRPAKNRAATSG
jgi:hypothetical protein